MAFRRFQVERKCGNREESLKWHGVEYLWVIKKWRRSTLQLRTSGRSQQGPSRIALMHAIVPDVRQKLPCRAELALPVCLMYASNKGGSDHEGIHEKDTLLHMSQAYDPDRIRVWWGKTLEMQYSGLCDPWICTHEKSLSVAIVTKKGWGAQQRRWRRRLSWRK